MSDSENNGAQELPMPSGDEPLSQLSTPSSSTPAQSKPSSSKDAQHPAGRRKHTRVRCQWTGVIQTTKKENFNVRVINVSLGGVGVLCPLQLPKGSKVLLNCLGHLGEKRCEMRAICIVAFSVLKGQDYQLGLQFESNIDGFRKFLVDYVNAKTVG